MTIPAATDRIAALDLVRGAAVLGILAINIASFAGGPTAPLSPRLSGSASPTDELAFVIGLVLFEGKMRGLFTLLFGASLLLLVDRRDATGDDGARWQARRLGWLLVIGYCHQLFLWNGDILMIYALIAPLALAMRHLSGKAMLTVALVLFTLWHGSLTLIGWSSFAAAEAAHAGTASPQQLTDLARGAAASTGQLARDLAVLRLPYVEMLGERLVQTFFQPLLVTLITFGETLPLMLVGMALYRSGLFSGTWPSARIARMGLAALAIGLPLAMAQAWWAWSRDFPPEAMFFLLVGAAGPQHFALTLAWLALLVWAAPLLAGTSVGQRLTAAGRMALSNYLLTSLVMTGIFHGWGLGLIGTVGPAEQWLFVLLGWTIMLGWSAPWLARFRQGPVEWLWRSLTERRLLPLKQ